MAVKTTEGKGATKLKTPEQHAADRRAAKLRKQRNHKAKATLSGPDLFEAIRLDKANQAAKAAKLAAEATQVALRGKMTSREDILEVVDVACQKYAKGVRIRNIEKDIFEMFKPPAKPLAQYVHTALRAFKIELGFQLTRSSEPASS